MEERACAEEKDGLCTCCGGQRLEVLVETRQGSLQRTVLEVVVGDSVSCVGGEAGTLANLMCFAHLRSEDGIHELSKKCAIAIQVLLTVKSGHPDVPHSSW